MQYHAAGIQILHLSSTARFYKSYGLLHWFPE